METPKSNYLERTEWNVRDSDATLIFTFDGRAAGGTEKTVEFCRKLRKPCLHFSSKANRNAIVTFLTRHQVKVLNIAGKKESFAPGISKMVLEVLDEVLEVPAKS
jgi:superfamily I DNA and RNA helicase